MFARVLRPIRRLRGALARWSVSEDREFHDLLFEAQEHDAFNPSYPGLITIRRFVDLVSVYLAGRRSVLDLGCGPGEITCELARRFPDIEFTGIDHSASAIARAHANATRAGVGNVRFRQSDAMTFVPMERADIVVMFDSFHHVVDPGAFVARLATFTDRIFLIEPAGDALGRWRRTVDFDWLPIELDKIRARIEHQLAVQWNQPQPVSQAGEAHGGRAVEHRYPIEDYERFFAGFHLEIRGTVAGLDRYPPQPTYDSRWRQEIMSVGYDLLKKVDDDLFETGSDAYGKHWAIYACKNASELRLPGRVPHYPVAPAPAPESPVIGPYEAGYETGEEALVLAPGVNARVAVTIVNRSWRPWSSDTLPPVHLSYHWLDLRRRPFSYDGLRTKLPRALPPGESLAVGMMVSAPTTPGTYLLEVDLVEEGVTWFSAAGTPPLQLRVRVR